MKPVKLSLKIDFVTEGLGKYTHPQTHIYMRELFRKKLNMECKLGVTVNLKDMS